MEKKTNTQSAEVAQTTSTFPLTLSIELTFSEIRTLQLYGEKLEDVMSRCGALEYMRQLQTLDFEYKNLLLAIDTGGFAQRPKDEDPAKTLEMLRGWGLTPQQNADRAYFLQNMADLLCAVDSLLFGLGRVLKEVNSIRR